LITLHTSWHYFNVRVFIHQLAYPSFNDPGMENMHPLLVDVTATPFRYRGRQK